MQVPFVTFGPRRCGSVSPPGDGGRPLAWPASGPPERRSPYSSMPFTFPSARRLSMIFWAMGGGTGS
jgi:hypothetical protein